MTALDVLERCRRAETEIARLTESIELRRTTLEKCSQQITGMPGGGGVKDSLATMVCEMADLERDLEQRRRAYAAELCAGAWIIDSLPAPEKDVMRGWYIERKNITRIAKECAYSVSSVKRLRRSGAQRCMSIGMSQLTGFLPDWYEETYPAP